MALCEVKSFEVLLEKLYAALAHELSLLESEDTSSLLVTNAIILVTSQVNLKKSCGLLLSFIKFLKLIGDQRLKTQALINAMQNLLQ